MLRNVLNKHDCRFISAFKFSFDFFRKIKFFTMLTGPKFNLKFISGLSNPVFHRKDSLKMVFRTVQNFLTHFKLLHQVISPLALIVLVELNQGRIVNFKDVFLCVRNQQKLIENRVKKFLCENVLFIAPFRIDLRQGIDTKLNTKLFCYQSG